jgi:hypothetical protein
MDRLAEARVLPPDQAIELPAIAVATERVAQVFNGVQLPVAAFGAEGLARFQLLDAAGTLLAVAHPAADGRIVYDRVFPELQTGPARLHGRG